MNALGKAVWLALEAAWPARVICLCCQRPSSGGRLCVVCQEALETLRITGPLCAWCGHPLEEGRCSFCHQAGAVRMRSVWVYQDQSRALVHALKYHAVAEAGRVLAEGMADVARTMALPPDTVVTWPTMPAGRRLERGVDHGRLLAEMIGERLGLPARRLLTRSSRVAKGTQRGRSRAERLTRLHGAFTCEAAVTGPVLLVDDVITTSATATACAQCLLDAGVSEVMVLSAGQVQLLRKKIGKDGGVLWE